MSNSTSKPTSKNVEELQKALAVSHEFLNISSHELKTPLTALLLQMELAKRAGNLTPEKITKIIDSSLQDVLRMKHMVDEMLDVSRIDCGKLSMHFDYFNLDEFMEEFLKKVARAYPKFHDVRVTLNTSVLVHWDKVRIEQVMMNLISNAFQFGEGKNIEIETSMGGNIATIIVRDHGRGISTEHLNKIFERVERGSKSRQTQGLGLGLFICREIVHLHKGVIKVDSATGKGSTFTIEIPFN